MKANRSPRGQRQHGYYKNVDATQSVPMFMMGKEGARRREHRSGEDEAGDSSAGGSRHKVEGDEEEDEDMYRPLFYLDSELDLEGEEEEETEDGRKASVDTVIKIDGEAAASSALPPPELCVEPPTPQPPASVNPSPGAGGAEGGFHPLQRTRHKSEGASLTTGEDLLHPLLLQHQQQRHRDPRKKLRRGKRLRSVSESETTSSSSGFERRLLQNLVCKLTGVFWKT